MGNFFIVHAYVNKNKDILLVPYKECKDGYALAVEPLKKISNVEWENISQHIIDMVKEIAKQPNTEDTETDVMKQLCGNKGFKQFSKKHICIQIMYKVNDKTFIISNQPRLPDGSYGTEKNSVSEMYCIEHIGAEDTISIQDGFLKAYEDAEGYLQKIGSKL